MEVKGSFNVELSSWSLAKRRQSDICITTNSKPLFLNEVESRSHNKKDVVVCVCDAVATKMENKIRQMGGGQTLVWVFWFDLCNCRPAALK